MIVKIFSAGKSFKGLGTYLMHDPKAETNERVAWTHTCNLANDHVPSAIDEMIETSRNAELLKQEAGIRAGGRETENPVKHFSLNWQPGQNPSREEMISASEDFLRHMNWGQAQAVLIAHDDKSHAHVHGMVNMVDPQTGLKLDESFEHRRAQAWALAYELEQGKVICENRVKDYSERELAPTRPAWMAFQGVQKSFERDEENRRNSENDFPAGLEIPKNTNAEEWKILKQTQREEREAFFADGKAAFSQLRNSIFREVREEFRPQWANYFDARKNGMEADELKEIKANILAEQNAMLSERRDDACGDLRKTRDGVYRELLDNQAEMRGGLRQRQSDGLSSINFLDLFESSHRPLGNDAVRRFGETGRELTASPGERLPLEMPDHFMSGREDNGRVRPGIAIGGNLSMGLGFGFASLFDGLADGLVASNPGPRPPPPDPESSRRHVLDDAAEEARQKSAREAEDRRRLEEEEQRARARQ